MQRGRQYEWRNCSCGRRGRICVCVPRNSMDPMLIHVMNESRRLRVIDELRAELDKDLLGVDAKWVLFGMAIQSYRYEQLLVPYPPAYCTPAGCNINSLSYVAGTMSEFASFQRRLLQNVLPPEQVELLHWLLIQSDTPQLRQLQRNDQLLLWRQLEQKPEPRPHLVFRVQQRNQDSGPVEPLDVTNCCYFCGDMEELYALIAAGSHDISNSELEFFDDLEQACSMAEWCPGWGYSICGTLLRSVAVCQLRQASPELPQLLQVRYLLIYSMNYNQKMQGIRRRQWKKIQQNQLLQQQLELELDQQQYHRPHHQQQQQQQHQQQRQQQLEKREQGEDELDQEEWQLEVAKQRDHMPAAPAKSSIFGWLLSRRNVFVVLGVLTVASLSLMAKSVRQVHQWRAICLAKGAN